jgi:hypothetical protein
MTLTKGQKVSYTFYGKPETATIVRTAGSIVWLDNGRWMHAESVTPIAGRSKRAKALRIRCNQDQELVLGYSSVPDSNGDTGVYVIPQY